MSDDKVTIQIPRTLYEKLSKLHEEACAENPNYKTQCPTVEDEIVFGLELDVQAMEAEMAENNKCSN